MNFNTVKPILSALIAGSSLSILAASAAHAQLMLTLMPTNIGTTSGRNVTKTFSATLVNLFDQPIYLNGDFLTVDGPLKADDTKFQNTFVFPTDGNGNLLPQPTLAANGGETTAEVFDITVPNTAPDGIYNGVFAIEHGFAPGDVTNTTAANFQIKVSPSGNPITPEPGAVALFVGLSTASMLCLRRRKAAR